MMSDHCPTMMLRIMTGRLDRVGFRGGTMDRTRKQSGFHSKWESVWKKFLSDGSRAEWQNEYREVRLRIGN